MFRNFRIAALSALLGLATLAAVPASAQANGTHAGFRGNGGYIGDNSHHHRDYGKRHHRDYGKRHHRHTRWERACTPREAIHKARRMGLHHARVVQESRRAIRVAGRNHRHHASIVFARAPHCPVIRYR